MDITGFLAQANGTYNGSNGDTAVEPTREEDNVIIVTFFNGVGCTFYQDCRHTGFCSLSPSHIQGQTRGLLGNNNRDKTDEFIIMGATPHLPDNNYI